MWDTCKGWWEGKIKVEVDEVLLLHRSRRRSFLSMNPLSAEHFQLKRDAL
jgi:hypothetical protein